LNKAPLLGFERMPIHNINKKNMLRIKMAIEENTAQTKPATAVPGIYTAHCCQGQ
jgi:hypothetical protein